jgi:hypothetical protein
MLRRFGILILLIGANGCTSKCDRAADHIVTLVYDEMIAEAKARPDADLVLPSLPSRSELAHSAGALAQKRLASYCAAPAVLDCVIASTTSRDARRCESIQ